MNLVPRRNLNAQWMSIFKAETIFIKAGLGEGFGQDRELEQDILSHLLLLVLLYLYFN